MNISYIYISRVERDRESKIIYEMFRGLMTLMRGVTRGSENASHDVTALWKGVKIDGTHMISY